MTTKRKFAPDAVPIYSVFATRLRELRKKAGLRQEDMARLLLIHRTAYTKYETDRATPDQDGLRKLSNLFQVSVDYLLGNDKPINQATHLPLHDKPVVDLSIQEQSLIVAFRQLSAERRDQLVQACREEARKHHQ